MKKQIQKLQKTAQELGINPANNFLKVLVFSALAGSLLFSSAMVVLASNGNGNGSGNNGGSSSSTCPTANYPARNTTTCIISANYQIASVPTSATTSTNVVIFHYNVTNINNGFTVDTSDVCITGVAPVTVVTALPNSSSTCAGTRYPSRVYFYVSGNISLSGSGGQVNHTANGGSGLPGAFRVYGNPIGGANQTFTFSGNVCFPGFIFAPTADAGINGGGSGCGITGAVWVNSWGTTTSNSNVAAVNVPSNLQTNLGFDLATAGVKVHGTSTATSWKRLSSN